MYPALLLPLILVVAAAAAAAWGARSARGARGVVRLAPSLVVAATALPGPTVLATGLAAALAGRGTALAGSAAAPGWRAVAADVAGALAAQAAASALAAAPPPVAALAVFAALVLAAYGVEALLAGRPRVHGRRLAFELANVAAGIVLAGELRAGETGLFAASVALVLLANHALATLARVLGDLQGTNEALAARVTELATLHAIGHEILSTLDPQRVFAIVDRECRKILDVDFFFLGLLDRDTSRIRVSYRAGTAPAPRETSRPIGDGLAAWVVRERRAIRVDDAQAALAAGRLPFRPDVVDPAIRSILAVPLLVEQEVVGVLSVQSRRASAYDEHQLSVLATIAQQAAVAMENARHYALATVDSLTGLYLRDYFFRRLEEEYARSRRYGTPFSILMLDLDDFKEINDRQGHLAGDRYLHALGEALKSRLRGADLACRYGGDEFCILLPETDLAGARPIAERIRLAVARLVVEAPGSSLRTTVSIGMSAYPVHDTGELRGLLLRADQALYGAKRAGRDRVEPFAA